MIREALAGLRVDATLDVKRLDQAFDPSATRNLVTMVESLSGRSATTVSFGTEAAALSGMTSEAIDESGVKVFISALALGIGRARRRFESKLEGANEPSGIGRLKPGRRTAIVRFKNESNALFLQGPQQRNATASRRFAFWPSVCVRHHHAA